jgi:hypothetical protein
MRRALLCYAAAALGGLLPVNTCESQMVQVAPGYVKAPFVRVYRTPDGGSQVRAPFVNIYTPGYRGARAYQVPTNAEFIQMDWRALSRSIREANAQLDSDLNQFPAGPAWKSRLKTAEVFALIPAESESPPTEGVRQQLQAVLETQSSESAVAEFGRVADLVSFKVLQLGLAEYVTPAEVRLQRQLFAAARDLNQALDRFGTGAGWQRYLRVAPGLVLSEEKTDPERPVFSAEEYIEALDHFDAVSQNSEYRMISSLSAFQVTRQRLASFLQGAEHRPAPSAEELPAPMPRSDP